ncbi:unnamed protein product [Cunninghamella blakesleeana]
MPPKNTNKTVKKVTNGSIKKKNTEGKPPVSKRKQKNKEFVHIPNANDDNVEISDEDLAFFEENQDFGSFLQSMSSKELSRKITKTNAPKKGNLTKAERLESVPEPMELSSSEDEDYEEDEGMIEQDSKELIDSEEEDSLLRDLSSDSESEDIQQQQLSTKTKKNNNNKKVKKNDSDDDEMDYELTPRKVASEWTKKDFVNKLPIKLPSGKVTEREDDSDEVDNESISEEEEEEVVKAEKNRLDQYKDNKKLQMNDYQSKDESALEESKLNKKQFILLKKEELATIASALQEDPEENIGRLKAFRDMYKKTENTTVRKLVLLAQLAVYKDIIPGYRIRLATEKEENVLVSKDVRKLRQYEKTLLTNYDAYLKELNALLSKRNTENDKSMAIVATKCLCELLISKPHFNYRLEIMVSIVARMSTYQWNEMAELSYNAIINVLEGDESGRISLDAVIMITRMIKSKHYVVNEKVITIFLHLKLMDEMTPVSVNKDDENPLQRKRKAKDKPFLNKKAKKALKETKEIEKEFQEAEAIVSKEEKDKHYTETLKLLFAFYFRVLKQYSTSPLLPNVLEGLARFSHLINVDFFNDLLNALRNVMQELNNPINEFSSYASANTRKCLLCIITAFQLLSGQGEAVNYDLKDFYKEIYQILLQATFHTRLEDDWLLPNASKDENEQQQQTLTGSSESESDLILRGIEKMFLKKRQIPIDRLAAFVKRFALVALNMPTKTVISCLNLVQRLINKDHRLDAFIQSEDRASTGIYMPLLQDPELCNPFGTSLYELFLYQNHYDPTIRALAQSLQEQPSDN